MNLPASSAPAVQFLTTQFLAARLSAARRFLPTHPSILCATLLFLALLPLSASADHIYGVFTGPGKNTITVKQRGKQVTGTLTYRGQKLRVTGWSDGGDYVRGQITGKSMSGTFELLYEGGPQPALELILYRGQFGAFLDQGRFIRTKAIPHSHAPKKAKRQTPKREKSSETPALEKSGTKRQLPYATPQNRLQRQLPYK